MTIARYSVYNGMPGYMPNSHWGLYEWTRRKDMASDIRSLLQMLDVPERRIREARIARTWAFIKRHGSSTAHFDIDIGNGERLYFSGLTEEEANAMRAAEEQ